MPQSLAQIWIHLVFSTKDRKPFLRDESFREQMCKMLAYHVGELKCASASVGGHFDHVHLLFGLSRTMTIAKLVEGIKSETSKWAKSVSEGSSYFAWQSGYGAFSVSHSNLDLVDRYIRNQDRHHHKMSFQEEFRKICERHNVSFDERYMWD